MNRILIGLVVLALLVGLSMIFIVDERELAIKFRLGEIVASEYEPGIHFKAPWPIMNVRKFDKRILTLDTRPERFLTGEKKNVNVDFFVKWRIQQADMFYTSFMGQELQAESRLLEIIKDGMTREFGKRTIQQVVSDDRTEIMESLEKLGNDKVAQFGIRIIDVRIKQIELPQEVRNSVFERMRTERERIAKELRAQGQETGKGITAVAERERTVILAEAQRDAEQTRGQGDARATEIYANAYGENPGFYEFYRSMNAYRTALANPNDVLVLEPDSEFFKYFGSDTGR